ncbi:hypothetical protein [Streptomyces sp. BA2]|uniref:hypothetical protein n=1 Tax=Streptomyces sp. BA2 TaxID=436595 RepID=UPI00132698DE|nr:hypothetical protein [Streptomyces sp. BA2]MWA09135.1 hypothetical protein [Streptomyces sp. BA2]
MRELICPRCHLCGQRHRWWAHRSDGIICPRCHLTERLTELLDDGTGRIAPALLPLHEAYTAQPNPDAGLVWLYCNRHVPPLLTALATGHLPLSHEALDDHPSSQTAMHLRDLLMQYGVLEQRDRYLVHFENWLRQFLAGNTAAEDRQLIQQFATWHSLHKLRHRAEHKGLTPGVTARHRLEVAFAQRFLAWLREHDTALVDCTQAHMDLWITSGNTSRQCSRAFIVWARANGILARHLQLPYPKKQPREALTHRDRLQLLHELLAPQRSRLLRDRAAAILLVLFAQPLTRIATLSMDDINLTSSEVQITFGQHGPVPVPEPFGQVLREHAENRGPYNIAANRTSPWLFPGRCPGRHIHPVHLRNCLRDSGIPLVRSRITALRALVSEMPPAIAAQAVGYTARCVEEHANTIGMSWVNYVPARRGSGELTTS